MASETQSSNTPVLLLTGFLGSGKTTLLNRLMSRRPPSKRKLAIIVNEFGAVGIDGDLLPAEMTRQVELPGGCICCVLNEDLDKTLNELLDGTEGLELIVIETTGIAEPLPISWSLAREPLCERVRLAAVITVVDACQFEESRQISPSTDAQVEYADILVASKMDLLDHNELPESLVAAVRELNPEAPLVTGSPDEVADTLWRAVADPDLSSAFDGQGKGSSARAAVDRSQVQGHDHNRDAALGGAHGFDSIWLPIEETIDFEEFAAQLEELPANYVRIKGIARVIDESTGSSEPHWIAFHRVGTRVSREPVTTESSMRIVALGPGVEQARLAACLDAAVVRSDTE